MELDRWFVKLGAVMIGMTARYGAVDTTVVGCGDNQPPSYIYPTALLDSRKAEWVGSPSPRTIYSLKFSDLIGCYECLAKPTAR